MGGATGARIAIDDGAAVLYSSTRVQEVVSWTADANAYDVVMEEGRVVERAYVSRTIG
jgi:hypothetical protein